MAATEIEEESISILTVSVNKEVKIIQNDLEIARSPAANVSDRKQTTLNIETENYGPDAIKNKILHEESHTVMDKTTEDKIEHGSTTSGNSGIIERLQKQLQKSERLQ